MGSWAGRTRGSRNRLRPGLCRRQLQHGVAVGAVVAAGDTKDDLPAAYGGPTVATAGSGDTKADLFASKPESQLGHGAAGYRDRAAGAGH